MFVQKYGTTGFDSFMCPEGVNPLFSQLCIFYYSTIWKNSILGATSEVMSQKIKISKSPKTDDLSKKKPEVLGEVHKCLDTWWRQGIIRPSQSPYASQVVIVQKKDRGYLSVHGLLKT